MTEYVKTHNLTKTYKQDSTEVHALNGVDITVKAGEFMALVGPSGSGKSTLLNLIGGLDSPTEGTVMIDGVDISSYSARQLADVRLNKIGFIFQEYNLIPVLTAIENVEYVMLLQGIKEEVRREKSYAMLKEVGLEGLEDRHPGELSGGQQQRVAIARAIVADPVIVLADEPTANLDSKNGAELLDLMKEINEIEKTTFIFSTHDPMVMERAHRIVTIKDGKIEG